MKDVRNYLQIVFNIPHFSYHIAGMEIIAGTEVLQCERLRNTMRITF